MRQFVQCFLKAERLACCPVCTADVRARLCVCVQLSPGSALLPASRPLFCSHSDSLKHELAQCHACLNPHSGFPCLEQRPDTCCFPSCFSLSSRHPPSKPLSLIRFPESWCSEGFSPCNCTITCVARLLQDCLSCRTVCFVSPRASCLPLAATSLVPRVSGP